MDKAQVRGFYSMTFTAFPGSQITVDEDIVDGDRAALRFTQRGTHQGEFMGLAATGRGFAMAGQTVLHFADMLGLLQQLGAMPAPAG